MLADIAWRGDVTVNFGDICAPAWPRETFEQLESLAQRTALGALPSQFPLTVAATSLVVPGHFSMVRLAASSLYWATGFKLIDFTFF